MKPIHPGRILKRLCRSTDYTDPPVPLNSAEQKPVRVFHWGQSRPLSPS